MITGKVVTITPAEAMRLLEKNTGNRTLNQRNIANLADQMKKGQWELNGETIIIAKTGMVVDGQHRLWAVVESGVTISTYLVEGVEESARFTVDTGTIRTGGHALGIMKVPNETKVSSIIRNTFVLAHQNMSYKVPVNQIVRFEASHPLVQESAAVVYAPTNVAEVPKPILGAVHFVAKYYLNKPANADAFVKVLTSQVPVYGETDAAHVAMRTFQKWNKKGSGSRMAGIDQFNIMLKAWDDFTHERQRKLLYAPANMVLNWKLEGFDREAFENDLTKTGSA